MSPHDAVAFIAWHLFSDRSTRSLVGHLGTASVLISLNLTRLQLPTLSVGVPEYCVASIASHALPAFSIHPINRLWQAGKLARHFM